MIDLWVKSLTPEAVRTFDRGNIRSYWIFWTPGQMRRGGMKLNEQETQKAAGSLLLGLWSLSRE